MSDNDYNNNFWNLTDNFSYTDDEVLSDRQIINEDDDAFNCETSNLLHISESSYILDSDMFNFLILILNYHQSHLI
jgi:hypothetical protein